MSCFAQDEWRQAQQGKHCRWQVLELRSAKACCILVLLAAIKDATFFMRVLLKDTARYREYDQCEGLFGA